MVDWDKYISKPKEIDNELRKCIVKLRKIY